MKYVVNSAPCCSYTGEKELRSAIEKVLDPQIRAYGSLSGSRILLKPNLLAYRRKDDLACVHRTFLLETIRAFRDAGAGVTVMVVMHTACKRQRDAEGEGKSGDAHMVLLV